MSDPDWAPTSALMRAEDMTTRGASERPARRLRAVRGAITVDEDTPAAIAEATRALLGEIVDRNDVRDEDLVSALFTMTPDMASDFPARAARAFGWDDVPILCAQEIAVPGALPMCLRVLLHIDSPLQRAAVQHVYLRGATVLRPDLAPRDPA